MPTEMLLERTGDDLGKGGKDMEHHKSKCVVDQPTCSGTERNLVLGRVLPLLLVPLGLGCGPSYLPPETPVLTPIQTVPALPPCPIDPQDREYVDKNPPRWPDPFKEVTPRPLLDKFPPGVGFMICKFGVAEDIHQLLIEGILYNKSDSDFEMRYPWPESQVKIDYEMPKEVQAKPWSGEPEEGHCSLPVYLTLRQPAHSYQRMYGRAFVPDLAYHGEPKVQVRWDLRIAPFTSPETRGEFTFRLPKRP